MNIEGFIKRVEQEIEQLKRDSFYVKNEVTFNEITRAIRQREERIKEVNEKYKVSEEQ